MEPIVASLWSSFRQVPPAAIPAMLDCILASTAASPSSLFSDLLNEFPNLTKGIVEKSGTTESEWHNCVVSYVAALSHFLKKSGAHHMHMFIWKMLIPLLKLVHISNLELFNEATSLFLDVVTETNSWEVLEATMVPLLLRSIGLSMGMSQSEDLAIYKWSENSTFKGPIDKKVSPTSFDDSHDTLIDKYICGEFLESHSYDLPFSISCHILTLTLDAALRNKDGVFPASTLASGSPAKQFAGNILWDLSNLTLQMLSQSSVHRSSAIRFLLPFIFKAFTHGPTFKIAVPGMNQVLTRKDYFMNIWKCCKLLFSLGSLERRDAYDILSLYLSFSSPTEQDEASTVGGREETIDLRADEDFWNEIKRGLLDKESLVRKQSLHILKTTLKLSKERKCYSHIAEEVSDGKGSDSHMIGKRGRWAQEEAKSLGVGRVCNQIESSFTGQHRWDTFVFLYEMLEEYGTHLVEAAWNHQIMLWLRSSIPLENSVPSVSEEQYHNRMGSAEQIFEWLAVLWERGFCHDNPQVRCLIMQSFLAIEWENYGYCAKLVPEDFILGSLIRGLNDPVHHREFGVKEIYSSWTIDAAARFMCKYASYMERRQHISFLVDLSSVPKTHSFGRAGLMCLVECIASAACGVLKDNNHEVEQLIDANTDLIVVESAPNSWKNDRSDLLDVLRFVVECSKQHFNPKYRQQVCEKILAAVASVMTAIDVPLEILLHFISSVPPEYTNYRGSLRHVVQKWLRGPNLQLLKAIQKFPGNFISYQHPPDSPFTFDDEQLDAWGSEAKRWARILFLVVEGEENFDPILKILTTTNLFMQFIEDHGGGVCKKKNFSEWEPVKFLILVSRLVEEVQIIQERTAKHCLSGRMKGETDFPGRIDNLSFVEESIIIDKFVVVLLSFLEELVAFTKLSCSIFGSGVVTEDVSLPGSIRGKLGGPSQRRLPSSLCTSVLEAISATKTLASILRCCAKFRTDGVTNSAQTFLWNFCWKIITTPAPKSEVEAEICLAAYEACAYALKDLVSVVSPSSLDLLANNYKSFPSEAEGQALLDAFVTTFIHNINNIVDGGKLTRSRRAVLISWKWSCLESLLSLPNYTHRYGVESKRFIFYFSDTIVTQIFQDLVGSLEHAGEVSVLPMLRSVRLSMELFSLKRTDLDISCCGGITIEMMWLLVHSSWILHVSCNKRRVAPIAALLSSVLHYSVFGDERMHEFDNGPGPLKWFVEKIVEEGTKSPRTIRLAALHLCGLWLAYPNTLKYYIKELKLLTFYGSVAFDEDFEAELAENHDARTEVSILSRRLDPELTDVFINTELYARVSVAVLFSRLADMAYWAKSTARKEEYLDVIGSGKMFLLELLNSVVNDKDLSKELYKKYSAIHRRKVRAWQMICVLSRFVDLDIVEEVTSSLHTSICRNNLPSVRQYLETFAIYIYLKFPSLVSQQLVPSLRNYDLRPQALSSYVFIAANVILHAKKVTQFGHLDELLPPIVPLLTSHHHTLRGFTQILLYQVLQKLLPDSNSSACDNMSLEQRCFVDLRDYLAHNSDCARLRASMDSYLDSFDPVKSISPAGIFTNRVEELEFECVPPTLMDRVIDFLNETREDLRSSMAKDAASIKIESILIDEGPKCSEILNSNGRQSVIRPQEELLFDFQRKITFSNNELPDSASTAFLDKTTSYGSLLAMANEDQLLDQLLHSRGMIVEKLKARRQQIILLASLIDRIPNLAGLARTCEVFRAAALAVADKSILNDKQFQLISVTAEKWVPVLEVPVGSMKVFLEKKKQEGCAILGLEQTANSVPLDQYNFPTKTVLVLGREKEGIPVEIIHMLDACIEIPQLGVVRSLNVHVSGAIALWEYTRQQRSMLNSK
ncbi:putative methyltransferase TARBP1 [Sesamum alatum]|uniref:tRNA (guanosine(18)-2'-O)-methyltransferase TARBP1 n=1 Tax=Sesamum alatum TaxID=300844 RepID=A0AAE1Y3G6_9LAMI|nr:putative methyltransferase TARBP1 [Sesamum alatum]